MKWFIGKQEYERAKLNAYHLGKEHGLEEGRLVGKQEYEKIAKARGIPSGNDECTLGIYNPPPPKPMTRAEAMKLVRESMTRTNIVADMVGTDTNGGFGDSWALGQVLVLEALGVLKVS